MNTKKQVEKMMVNKIQKVETKQAPQALGPYSQGIVAGSFLFVSGQLPINPQTGKLIEGSIQDLTKQVIQNIQAILETQGLHLNDVVRTDVFLKDLKNFTAFNEEYARHFTGSTPPARQTIQVADLPLGSPVEISCIAYHSS